MNTENNIGCSELPNNHWDRIREQIRMANERNISLGHILLHGNLINEKIKLAEFIAREIGSKIHICFGNEIIDDPSIGIFLEKLNDRDILFIDDMHHISYPVVNTLCNAMKDYQTDIVFGEGEFARSSNYKFKHFTIIGADEQINQVPLLLSNNFETIVNVENIALYINIDNTESTMQNLYASWEWEAKFRRRIVTTCECDKAALQKILSTLITCYKTHDPSEFFTNYDGAVTQLSVLANTNSDLFSDKVEPKLSMDLLIKDKDLAIKDFLDRHYKWNTSFPCLWRSQYIATQILYPKNVVDIFREYVFCITNRHRFSKENWELYNANIYKLNTDVFNGLNNGLAQCPCTTAENVKELYNTLLSLWEFKNVLSTDNEKLIIDSIYRINTKVIKDLYNSIIERIEQHLTSMRRFYSSYLSVDNMKEDCEEFILLWKYEIMLSENDKELFRKHSDEIYSRVLNGLYSYVIEYIQTKPHINAEDAQKMFNEYKSIQDYGSLLSGKSEILFRINLSKIASIYDEKFGNRLKKLQELYNSVSNPQEIPDGLKILLKHSNTSVEEQLDKNIHFLSSWIATAANKEPAKHYDAMDGIEFEMFCAELLSKNGYTKVEVTSGSGDFGVDVLAEKDGVKYAIQCKRYESNIGNAAVQEVFSGKEFYKCHIGVVMTNQHFTSSAIETANRTGIILWDREQLEKMITATK